MRELSCGIVGLPNVGKSTLFNALTGQQAAAANFPFCTIEANVGIVDLPDPRLEGLSARSHSKRIVPATVRFVDIAGLVEGASQGEGLGNKFLGHIRETAAIVHVVRCFDDENIVHVMGNVNPRRDSSIINGELILSDLQSAEQAINRLSKQVKSKKELQPELDLLHRVSSHLEQTLPLRILSLTEEELVIIRTYRFLTMKPMIYAANVAEKNLKVGCRWIDEIQRIADEEHCQLVLFCAELEAQIAQLGGGEERQSFLEALGLESSGLSRLIQAGFHALGLINYFTTGEMETRAWPIFKGTSAQQAAGEIHSDIERGFIRAEVLPYQAFVELGKQAAKEQGLVRFEGRNYEVQDGDVILFHHS